MMTRDEFVDELASHEVDLHSVNNMYSFVKPENKKRRDNLRAYLGFFEKHQPDLILIGEAPGYRGCGDSGIPFTSTGILKTHPFFKNLIIHSSSKVSNEATATIFWEYLLSSRKTIMGWNAYPFHPFVKNKPKSNRKPISRELETGKMYVDSLLGMYPGAKVVAIGKVAQSSLRKMGFNAPYVRHPSYGGKADFLAGLDKLTSPITNSGS